MSIRGEIKWTNEKIIKSRTQSAEKSESRIQRKDIKNCPYFLKGNCKYGYKCQWLHDNGLKKYIQKNCESENDDENDKKSSSKISRQAREKGKEVQHSSYIVTYDEDDNPISMVPLPTQNFRD